LPWLDEIVGMLFFNLSGYSQNELLHIGYHGHCSGEWTAILVPLARLVLLCVGIKYSGQDKVGQCGIEPNTCPYDRTDCGGAFKVRECALMMCMALGGISDE